jgi:hypothetical protein
VRLGKHDKTELNVEKPQLAKNQRLKNNLKFIYTFFNRSISYNSLKMKSKIKLISLLFFVSFLFSCYTNKKYNVDKITLGMNKTEVINKLGKKPKNIVGAKSYPKGLIEVLEYKRREPWLGITTNHTYFYFLNDTLRQYGNPSDWQTEADKIYQTNIKK